jgi:dephospho-CoA kinase
VVIDADRLAREVVDVGSAGLAAVRTRFGDVVIAPDGTLDRGALGAIVFADAQARQDLEDITHPLIASRTSSLMERAEAGKIVVHDVPLLVELDLAAAYHLTVVVGAENDIRLARLTGGRGFTEADARARMASQAGDRERRAAADAWLDNNGSVEELLVQVDTLWQDRIVGFNDNLISGSASRRPGYPALVAYDDSWPSAAARLIGRVTAALGDRTVAVEHIGSTSVPGLVAEDVIELQLGVRAMADADEPGFVRALADMGFPRASGVSHLSQPVLAWVEDAASRSERIHGSADPGRLARVHVREKDGPAWRAPLLLRDWLRAEPGEREAYSALERRLAENTATTTDYVVAKRPWLEKAFVRADAWAGHTGWSAS